MSGGAAATISTAMRPWTAVPTTRRSGSAPSVVVNRLLIVEESSTTSTRIGPRLDGSTASVALQMPSDTSLRASASGVNGFAT